MKLLRENFQFNADAEISIEVHPREIELDVPIIYAPALNRLSMGVQDFNKEVQRLVNREQDEEFIFALRAMRDRFYLHQHRPDLRPAETDAGDRDPETCGGAQPHRLSVFNYAHLPTIFAAQRKIKDADLPSPQQKLDILQETIAFLTQLGYQFIGMDHFARPDDELAVAQREGVLHRNFQGYTTQALIPICWGWAFPPSA